VQVAVTIKERIHYFLVTVEAEERQIASRFKPLLVSSKKRGMFDIRLRLWNLMHKPAICGQYRKKFTFSILFHKSSSILLQKSSLFIIDQFTFEATARKCFPSSSCWLLAFWPVPLEHRFLQTR